MGITASAAATRDASAVLTTTSSFDVYREPARPAPGAAAFASSARPGKVADVLFRRIIIVYGRTHVAGASTVISRSGCA
jgi:hypothetical protein